MSGVTNRCDYPGCESHVTYPYFVGLGGMLAFYCRLHAPKSSEQASAGRSSGEAVSPDKGKVS